jgi:DNA-binding MarR family transcriptional regulator
MRLRYAILAGLEEFGPISQAELSRRLGVDRGDLVKALNELEAEGMAARSADPSDRRRNSLQLTPDGATALIRLDALVGSAQTRLLAPLSSDEREQLNSLLQRLLDHHDGHNRP